MYSATKGDGVNEVSIPTGNLVDANYNDIQPNIYLMPNCGVQIFVDSNYGGKCQLEAYNNTDGIVIVSPTGGNNSSLRVYQNTFGGFTGNTGSYGYTPVYNTAYG